VKTAPYACRSDIRVSPCDRAGSPEPRGWESRRAENWLKSFRSPPRPARRSIELPIQPSRYVLGRRPGAVTGP